MYKESGLFTLKDINVHLFGKVLYNVYHETVPGVFEGFLCTITKFMNIIPEHWLTRMCPQMTLIYVKLVLGIREYSYGTRYSIQN